LGEKTLDTPEGIYNCKNHLTNPDKNLLFMDDFTVMLHCEVKQDSTSFKEYPFKKIGPPKLISVVPSSELQLLNISDSTCTCMYIPERRTYRKTP